ncbi:MAG: YciI family protein [Bryobacteraceae bacterium]|jgi:hypothetical protein
MKYLFLTYLNEKTWLGLSEVERERIMAEPMQHVERLIAGGKFLGGSPLHPSSEASTVRVSDGKRVITDGPFAETRELVGGYTLIEATDRDEAIAIAADFLGPNAQALQVTIEVRQVAEMPGVPTH